MQVVANRMIDRDVRSNPHLTHGTLRHVATDTAIIPIRLHDDSRRASRRGIMDDQPVELRDQRLVSAAAALSA
jgi:hypothetical protein